ncbi:1-deoxy-D-xylulose-5-phosphate synthase [Klebsiella pneumoniae]|uniref:1-deoxy-D-xylulose-5-phosphate synthase n=1 Tax=Klebsiella pneumoniae TaxID=573 RepID=A0A2X3E4V7_KLEPN|nr:1-deoxy-D-xylulose-5-phosphate synthase [Klebsiella pneumoniae]
MKRQGEKIAILNFGTLLPEAAAVADKLNATLVDMRFVKPLDTALILQLAGEHDALVTLEENAIMGGAGSGVNEVLMAHRRAVPVLNIGLPDYLSLRALRKRSAPTSALMPPVLKPKSATGWHNCPFRSCYA